MFNFNDFNLQKEVEKNNEYRNEILKKMFGKFMKPSTMIRLKEEIKKSDEFNLMIPVCYNFQFNPVLALGVDDIDFDLCSNLAMIYWYENLFETDEAKSKNLKDSKYCENLKNKAVFQCRLRLLYQYFDKSNNYLSHTSIHYSIRCMVNFLLMKLDDKLQRKIRPYGENGNFKINTLIVLLKNIKSILLLTETDNCGSAFSLLRTVIETVCVYFTINDNELLADEFYNFMQYRLEFEQSGEYPQEFTERAPKNFSWQNYLNYGWLDTLENKNRKYVFSELLEYTKMNNVDLKNNFNNDYKYCCKFSHGNYLNQSIGAYDFIWILGRIGLILLELASEYSRMFSENIEYDGINLANWLTETTIESFNIYQKQTNKK